MAAAPRDSRSISAFDCDVIREAFRQSVVDEKVPADRWRAHAAALTRSFTGLEDIDPERAGLDRSEVSR